MNKRSDSISGPVESRLADGLTRLAAVARQLDWQTAEAEKLTPTQADILRFVAGRPNGVRLAAAASHTGVRSATASEAVTTLERKGLVGKHADPEDGRAILLRATRDGDRMANAWPSSFDPIVQGLDPDDADAAFSLVVKMIRNLQQRGLIAPQRTCMSCQHFRENAFPGTDVPHRCELIDTRLADRDLRIDCPEHLASAA